MARFLERRGILKRDAENSYLTLDGLEEDPLLELLSDSVTYRIAIGTQKGRNVFCLQTIPPISEVPLESIRLSGLDTAGIARFVMS